MLSHHLPRHEILESDATLITNVPEINQWHLRGHTALASDGRIVEMRGVDQSSTYMARMSELYLTAGPGDHICQDLVDLTQAEDKPSRHAGQLVAYGLRIQALVPELVSAVVKTESPDGKSHIGFGRIALAERHATAEELADFKCRVDAAGGEKLMYKKNALYEQEQEKTQLATVDHVLIEFDGKQFSLDLDSPESILATRVMQLVAQHPKTVLGHKDLYLETWRSMTIAERMLFTDKESQIFENTCHILAAPVEQIVRKLLFGMGVIRNRRAGSLIDVNPEPLTIHLVPLPPDEPYDPAVVRCIYPFGVDKDLARSRRLGALTEQEIASAEKLLSMAMAPGRCPKLDHEQAVRLLGQITDDRTKQALRVVQGATSHQELVEILDVLHMIVRQNLGWSSYCTAKPFRTIRGGLVVKSKQVDLIGGRPKGETVLWHIGETQLSSYKDFDGPKN
ncbi:MAG TPA: hypothetical protein VF733_06585 [Candidatus Saccharimonadales bacterium]